MKYAGDLIRQAKELAMKEPRRPRQASLRRAVSAAYYAVFHMLIEDAALRMLPGKRFSRLRTLFRRAFEHSDMKEAAKPFANGSPAQQFRGHLPNGILSHDLCLVARIFGILQEQRHMADYDFQEGFTRRETLDLVEQGEQAVAAWRRIRDAQEARVFLVALLIQRKVRGR